MSDSDELVICPMPSLLATLLNRERAKGSPLTEEEVLRIRDECPAVVVPRDFIPTLDESRGYKDIDPDNCWEEWQEIRKLHYDYNHLERTAFDLKEAGRLDDALRIYFFMADGDPSLDGGSLAGKIGECCELKKDLVAARYWYGVAFEVSGGLDHWQEQRDRLPEIAIDDLLPKPAA